MRAVAVTMRAMAATMRYNAPESSRCQPSSAAIHAARDEKEIIEWDDVDWAIDRVTVGMEKPNKDALVQDIELVAFHEAGHAIMGALTLTPATTDS